MSVSIAPESQARAKSLSRFKLPGFGLPLNFTPHGPFQSYEGTGNDAKSINNPAEGDFGPLFRSALNCDENSKMRLTPLREFKIMQLMNQITDKVDWSRKVFDESIVEKWRSESVGIEGIDVTSNMFDWCIEELRFKTESFSIHGAISVYDGDVVKSDSVVPQALMDELKTAVKTLEQVPDSQKDWHPGSNDTVLDLVHPSLFPVVYGRSKILPDIILGLDEGIKFSGGGKVLSIPPKEECCLHSLDSYDSWRPPLQDPFSQKFQWLPSDIVFTNGGGVRISSYINNLHPVTHKIIYEIIEKIIARAIPLWNMTLTPLQSEGVEPFVRIPYDTCEYDPDPNTMPDDQKPQQEEDENDDDFWERTREWQEDIRRVVIPDAEEFEAPSEPEVVVDLRRDYAEKGIQVIVKLASIHLTPENPQYQGGTWHVEGQMNEHICATALYYYDSFNISESRLAFRQQSNNTTAEEEIESEQHQHDWLTEVFGCNNDTPAIQDVGDVVAKQGRLITFPNIFQHRVLPFGLEDVTKPGHRKILALFLVDPHIRIISSANVPAQQRHWWSQELRNAQIFSKLPVELTKAIIDGVDDFPISMEDAKATRLELMEERKAFVIRHDEKLKETTFSLCEH